MSGKRSKRERAQERERQDTLRRNYQRRRDASPLPEEEKRRLEADGAYLAARLRGEAARPPDHWPPAQIAAFAGILADPTARSAVLAELLRAFQRLVVAADAPPEDGG